jgi:hypothetical protein
MSGRAHPHGRRVRLRATARARGREGGLGTVEAALALPIFLVVMLGFVDLGLGVFQSSQVTSAAADGARVGMVRHSRADVASSNDRQAIEQAIHARLPGQAVQTITVACIRPGGTTVTCNDAEPSEDRLRVSVSWQYEPISPLASAVGGRVLTGTATMGIVEQPVAATTTTAPGTTTTTTTTTTTPATTTTTAPPSVCSVTSIASTPSTVQRKSNGQLWEGFAVSVTTNGSAQCTSLSLSWTPGSGSPATATLTKQSSTLWTVNITKNAHSWTSGTKTTQVLNGTTVVGSGTLVVVTT